MQEENNNQLQTTNIYHEQKIINRRRHGKHKITQIIEKREGQCILTFYREANQTRVI